jgi:hypothetical protein
MDLRREVFAELCQLGQPLSGVQTPVFSLPAAVLLVLARTLSAFGKETFSRSDMD